MASTMLRSSLVRSITPMTRSIHATACRRATSPLTMPALSPTMTEGSVTQWLVKEGDTFVAGDVLLQIETDKAAIDVEAQDDGVLGKILVQNNTSGVQVGSLIALLAEEGDDLSAIEVPSTSASSSSAPEPPASTPSPPSPSKSPEPPKTSTPPPSPAPTSSAAPTPSHHHDAPKHSHPLLPSVYRLLSLSQISDATKISATGHKGLLTKGDVLAYLGKIKSPFGSVPQTKGHEAPAGASAPAPKKVLQEMDGQTFRQLITLGLSSSIAPPKTIVKSSPLPGFDEVLSQYAKVPVPVSSSKGKKDPFDEILGL